ncbi:hypothetical protein C0993_005407 [Termitomyces sp. T159_Od127]|nr:hypothetical protein C0993_005407 [Termitomyces sp. T159_Od127]
MRDSGYWNALFNINIPGWLPPSAVYGIEGTGIQYTLFAEVKYTVVCDNDNNSFSLLCSPFRSRIRHVETQKSVLLRRLIPSDEGSHTNDNMVLQPRVTYLVKAKCSKDTRFPVDVFSTLQVLATVPEYIDIENHVFPLTIRMRTKGLSADECKRIQVNSVSVDVVQKERYRSSVVEGYRRRHPMSPPKQQPPHLPLRDPHPMAAIYESGLSGCIAYDRSVSREFSILPSGEPGFHSLGEDNYPFAKDADIPVEWQTWYTLESSVPFVHRATDDKTVGWGGPSIIRPSLYSPLISVLHEAVVDLECAYVLPETEEIVTERISFLIPLRFQFFAPDIQLSYGAPGHVSTQSGSPMPSLPSPKPYTSSLPAYSQLFDHNGDRKIDHTTPLPLYTPRASPSASSSSLSSDSDMDSESENLEMREINPLLSSRYGYDSD